MDKQTEIGKAAQEAAGLVDFSIAKLQEFFTAVEGVLQQYGGDVVDLGLAVLRIDAASQLLVPIFLVTTLPILLYKLWNYKVECTDDLSGLVIAVETNYVDRKRTQDLMIHRAFGVSSSCVIGNIAQVEKARLLESKPYGGPSPWKVSDLGDWAVFMFIAISTITIALVISLYNLINLWAWIGMFYPEAYAVHKILL